jgi:putative SOS response-associated peptidase YedK
VCDNYNMTSSHQAMIEMGFLWDKAQRNLPPLYGIYPNYFAPVIHEQDGDRHISLARWGLPSLKDAPTQKPNRGNTNIRHPGSTGFAQPLGRPDRRAATDIAGPRSPRNR